MPRTVAGVALQHTHGGRSPYDSAPVGVAARPMTQLVWYRRDLRVQDHAPLLRAARRGPVLPLFVAETARAQGPDVGARHWTFARDALRELRAALAALGQPLVVRSGAITAVLGALHEVVPFAAIWTHEETGRLPVAARLQVARDWAAARGIPYHELSQDGVMRGGAGRGRWVAGWEARLGRTPLAAPEALRAVAGVAQGAIPTHQALGLPPEDRPVVPDGGTAAGLALLAAFLDSGGATPASGPRPAALADPLRALAATAHLGPHLAWGTLSPRQVLAAVQARRAALDAGQEDAQRALAAFAGRLRARDRAIQRLHDTPAAQLAAHASLHPAFDARHDADPPWLAAGPAAPARLAAWRAGETGYPLVDAAMRQLRATGWLPHPLRALVVACASHALWLPWQRLDHFLARQWLDYEPGVHLDQLQHHAGVGPDAPPRLPDPVALGRAHDPTGAYVRRWLPALRAIPDDYLHEPWLLPVADQERLGCRIGTHYPAPLVEHESAARAARAAIAELRRRPPVAAALAAARAEQSGADAAKQLALF